MPEQLPPPYSLRRSRILLVCTASVMVLPLLLPTWKTMAAGICLPVHTQTRLDHSDLPAPAVRPLASSLAATATKSLLPKLEPGTGYMFRTLEPPRSGF